MCVQQLFTLHSNIILLLLLLLILLLLLSIMRYRYYFTQGKYSNHLQIVLKRGEYSIIIRTNFIGMIRADGVVEHRI